MSITRGKPGFTMVELMVVMAIIAIIAAIAVPNFRQYMVQKRLSGAARQVMSDMMAARMRAISENRKVEIFFTGSQQYKICDDANGDGNVGGSEGTVQSKNIQVDYPDVTFTATANPVFNKNGTAATMTTVTLSNSSGTRIVSVAMTGRVLIQ